MPDLALGGGVDVVVETPGPPAFSVPAPTSGVAVVPVAGPAGPPGSTYTYSRSTPASTWAITHNLGTFPVPTVLLDDAPTRPVWTDVEYPDANTLILTFPTPVTGRIYL